jgi:DNA-binding response OmpR family regulator
MPGIDGFSVLYLDFENLALVFQDSKIELTAQEFKLMELLIPQLGEFVNRPVIESAAFGFDSAGNSRQLDSAIIRIRGKLRKAEIPYSITIKKPLGLRLEAHA